MTETSHEAESRKPTVVSLLPIVLVLTGGLFLLSTLSAEFTFTGKPIRDMFLVAALMNFGVYISIRVFSQLTFRRQIWLICGLVVVQLALYWSLRIDGLYGNGRPVFVWSWTPTRDAKFREQVELSNETESYRAVKFSPTKFDVPSFRGRENSGIVNGVPIQTNWEKHPPEQIWRRPVGAGWSSFAIVGDYCVTQEQRGEHEAVVCYELATGKLCWIHLDRARFFEVTSLEGPRATPTIDDGRVYSLGATGILNCLDGERGKRIWHVNVLKDNEAENRIFGMTSSPLVLEKIVVVSPGGKEHSLVAYDKQTGKRVWQAGDGDASYSSPQLSKIAGKQQILIFNGDGLFAHNAGSGNVLWNIPWVSNPSEKNNVCQPVAILANDLDETDRVFISSEYGMGCALFDILRKGNTYSVVERWANKNMKAKFTNVVLHDGQIYGLDNGILACLDIKTGKRAWKGGRYGHGQIVLVNESLVVQSEHGYVALVDATPDSFRELGRIDALAERTWNHPVVAGDWLLVRNSVEAACYRLSRK